MGRGPQTDCSPRSALAVRGAHANFWNEEWNSSVLFHTANNRGGETAGFQVANVSNITSYPDFPHPFIQNQNMFILNTENKLQRFFEKTEWPIWGRCPRKLVDWASKDTLPPFFRRKSLPSFLDTCSIWISQLTQMTVITHLLPLLIDSNYEVFVVLVKEGERKNTHWIWNSSSS